LTARDDRCAQYADRYDQASVEMEWHGPEVAFGLMYAHVKPEESLLDIGIGTGLGSVLFHEAGLKIHGMDSSPSMLAVCRKKHPVFRVVEHDLTQTPWPFKSGSFGHVVSTGVLHFAGDLQPIADEVARVLRPGGTFGFDFAEHNSARPDGYTRLTEGVFRYRDTEYNETVYRHEYSYILSLLNTAGFRKLAETEFLASRERMQYFRTIVARWVQHPGL
jgi:predicted TPR repeat methyltransferase